MSNDPADIVEREWAKGIKRDPSAFAQFTKDEAWEEWNRSFTTTTKAQMLDNILDPNYVPMAGTVDTTKFRLQQTYMYDVLNKIVQTNHGKSIVRKLHPPPLISTFLPVPLYSCSPLPQ